MLMHTDAWAVSYIYDIVIRAVAFLYSFRTGDLARYCATDVRTPAPFIHTLVILRGARGA